MSLRKLIKKNILMKPIFIYIYTFKTGKICTQSDSYACLHKHFLFLYFLMTTYILYTKILGTFVLLFNRHTKICACKMA